MTAVTVVSLSVALLVIVVAAIVVAPDLWRGVRDVVESFTR
jgi:hypothetical protein